MIIAAMQPYLLPYLGYFQLIAAVDCFVVCDDYQYRRHGWINRNRILKRGQPHLVTLPVRRASHRLPINQRYFMDCEDRERRRRLKNFAHAYGRAPHVEETLSLIEGILGFSDLNVARFIDAALRRVCDHIRIRTPFTASSALNLDPALRGQDRTIGICQELGATTFINPGGGASLLDRSGFAAAGITLKFLETNSIRYPQFGGSFVPKLAIIDVLMFNDRPAVEALLTEYRLL